VIGYVVRRTLQAIVVLFGVSIVVFAIVHLVPGDPIRLALGTRFNPQAYDALRRRSGLDKPLVPQYFYWLGHALTGDLGVSFRTGQPVTQLIGQRIGATVSLAGAALVVALVIAVPLGLLSALRPRTSWDYGATVISQTGISIPEFWLAILLILVVGAKLDWLPSAGYVPPGQSVSGWLEHLILPGIAAGVSSGSILTRFIRASALEALGRDYTLTARSKGLRERTIIVRHVIRNALVPVVTVTGVQLAYLLSGVVVVEVVFAWPGLGMLALQSVQSRDYPVLQGAVVLFAAFFLIVNLAVDLLYARLDPRIGYASR
jgi:peptide/nickel transport system permease protein